MANTPMLRAFRNSSISFSSTSTYRYLSTLVLAEHEGGSLKAQSLSAVEAAKSLSEDNFISMLLAGSGPSLQEAAALAASCHPSISQVLLADSEKFKYPLAEPWAKLLHLVQQKGGYSHIIAASGSFGKNILPRAAALLDVSPVTDVIKISESHLFVRPIYAGNALCTVRYTGSNPCMLSIRSTSFPVTSMSADSKSNAAPIDPVDLTTFDEDGMGTSKYVKQTTQESERPDLGNARVVITGGRALKSAENFKMLEKLAEKLGAAVGATRAAVDAGYVPNDLQAQMNDASEVLGVIFDCLHRSFTSGFGVSDTESIESNVMGSWDCENSTYVAHSLFGMNVFESLNCYNCGMESKNMKYTSFFHNINASVLRTMKVICPESSFVSFSTLLK